MKRINNEANIQNANKGVLGVNDQYAKNEGNRGKQLNPNQKSSLIIMVDDDKEVSRLRQLPGTEPKLEFISFKKEFIDKGFLKEIGARRLSNEEAENRDIRLSCGNEAYKWGYILIEFLREKDNEWTVEEANTHLIKAFTGNVGHIYRDEFWLNGNIHKNHKYVELAYEEEIFYCPAIDGY